ncbi:hypothetical protein ACVI1J_005158 [Bradyrhizobium diazoefficiens]
MMTFKRSARDLIEVGSCYEGQFCKEGWSVTSRPGAARITVEWGYDLHEITLTPRNWSRVKRGGKLRIRSRGFSEDGPQWEYWSFAGGLDGDLSVEYGEDGGVGFVGKLHDATIEEAK